MGANLVGAQAVDIGPVARDQRHRKRIELLEVVGRVVQRIPLEPEPGDVFLDGVDVLDVFLGRIGVVEAQVAGAAALGGDAEIEADRLGVPDMQVAVRLRRKPGDQAAAVFSGHEVFVDDLTNEIGRTRHAGRFFRLGHCRGHSKGSDGYGSRVQRDATRRPSSPGTHTTTALAPAGPVLWRTLSGGLTNPDMPGVSFWLTPLTTGSSSPDTI